jgi:hypothetical protein
MSEETTVIRTTRKPHLDEGLYDATVSAVEAMDGVQTPYGVKDKIVVTFDVKGCEIKRRYNKSLFPSSNLYEFISELAGEPGDAFDVAELVGERCRVMISHATTDAGDVWENVESVKKSKPKSTLA